MPSRMKYQVELTESLRQELNEMVSHGVHNAREIRRARTLLLLDDGWERKDIAEVLNVSLPTITRTAREFCEGGIEEALFDKARSGRPREITNRDEARITAIATSEPPEGRAKWTLALIRDDFLTLSELDDISTESIRLVLKKRVETVADSPLGHQ